MMNSIQIDVQIPGGNIIVKAIDGNQVLLNRDMRDTKGNWIYWKFRAVFPSVAEYTFCFDDSYYCLTSRGPAVSLDKGKSWTWSCTRFHLCGTEATHLHAHGTEATHIYARDTEAFSFTAEFAGQEVWFCQCIPYMESNLNEFLATEAARPIVRLELCKSRKGRSVELLRLGNGPRKVFLSSRHHCQESMATYALEGILSEVATHPQEYSDFTFWAVPFVDKDGVEDGDQGKNRMPHDHARDYGPDAIYPEVHAIMELIHREKPVLVFDMHCPWVRNGDSEHVYFVGQADARLQAGIDRFSEIIAREAPPDFPTDPRDNIPFGQGWNTSRNYEQGSPIVPWCATLPWQPSAQSIEIPFANTHDVTVTADSARHLGNALARSIREYLAI